MLLNSNSADCAATRKVFQQSVDCSHQEVERYLAQKLEPLRAGGPSGGPDEPSATEDVAEAVFRILTHRRFSYLGKTRAEPYRPALLDEIRSRVAAREPLRFYYDIGGGYHASILPRQDGDLSFDVGLAEVLLLSQVVAFIREVEAVYAPGARFWLVIDNVCALFVNDIQVHRTEEYCRKLRGMIAELGQQERIALLVESEQLAPGEYQEYLNQQGRLSPTPTVADIENVSRFVGHSCDEAEASQRMRRYAEVSAVSEAFLQRSIDGVRMTQRATADTFGFRPFPGGDSRVQCGEVAITRNSNGKLHPILVTSANLHRFELIDMYFPDKLPSMVPVIHYAESIW